ncbi:hypothetical protein FEM54_18995 [Pseudomonas edaphica]|uniref:Uncharacterized protein n=1 Tax=Pseudomonas edaphica TaxID=2006980 RepID=A0A5R8QWY4_9PSED|nr:MULTISPECIES: hypothetical protein [Pseudomonas]MCF5228786.1 hypothetical protein [Pseudomonas sp. PA-5-4H]MCF5235434.1 hypothetical protein [Pseudomonas sp. PA-5-4G]MCF5248635.1 hypothetical protein [Pseudomonas sp. PA-5-4B]MCF5257240.1 hypothetical protein [Pseudomonas sp. PA-5-4B]MCF5258136.1 hypothetical protein [Pseudomonas sp. PA-5-4A]
MIVHFQGPFSCFQPQGGLAAITSRAGRDAQGCARNIGRLSDSHAIIAILPMEPDSRVDHYSHAQNAQMTHTVM